MNRKPPDSDDYADEPRRFLAEHSQPSRNAKARRIGGLTLIRSLRQHEVSLVAELIALGVDVNVQDERGNTALHYAAALGARPSIRLLVNSGRCNYLLRNKRGRYAYQLALISARDPAVARLLIKKQLQQAVSEGVLHFDRSPPNVAE